MKKIMFDSMIIDKLPSYIEKLKKSVPEYQYYVTSIQVDEISQIPDTKKNIRRQLMLMLVDLRAILVPLSIFLLGKAHLGYARLGNGKVFHEILNENRSNESDAAIADTAVTEGCTLVTEDRDLYQRMKKHNYDVMCWEDFLNEINLLEQKKKKT